MVVLRTFGGFDVDVGTHGRAVGFRPRIVALLALLIVHGPRGVSRDKILAYLWPESDSDHARNSLKQALFSLRHAFSDPVVVWGPGLLRLNPVVVEVDLWLFESALAKSQMPAAVSLYRGPFLDGFYVSGLAEFERWAELERQRLAAAYADALKTLATMAEAAADWAAAAVWWRRLTEAAPFSTPAVLGLMRALESAGDPTAAVEQARRHAALVREELDCPVADEVRSFLRRLVNRSSSVTGGAPTPAIHTQLELAEPLPGHPASAQAPDRGARPRSARLTRHYRT
ncbi:MAG TPA: BTAD domain-containing putative transcriptional regulator [Micromonosporaceae bacterium]